MRERKMDSSEWDLTGVVFMRVRVGFLAEYVRVCYTEMEALAEK